MLRIGMLLSGCGTLDGSDPLQVIALRVAASRAGDLLMAFAPDRAQTDVMGRQGPIVTHTRHALEEAMRLTGGRIDALEGARADELDVLVVPGGLGATKTLHGDRGAHGADLALGVLAGHGALVLVDEGVAWAAAAIASDRLGAWDLAVGNDPDLAAIVQASGHRPRAHADTWVTDASHHVFSLALDGDPMPHRVLDLLVDGIEQVRRRLTSPTGHAPGSGV